MTVFIGWGSPEQKTFGFPSFTIGPPGDSASQQLYDGGYSDGPTVDDMWDALSGAASADAEAVRAFFLPKTQNILTLWEVGGRPWYPDNAQYIQEWLPAAQAKGAIARLTKEDDEAQSGVYNTSPNLITLAATKKLRTEGTPNAWIKALPDPVGNVSDIAVIRLESVITDVNDPTIPDISISHFNIDASERAFVVEAPTGTAITVRNLGVVNIDDCIFYGSPDYETGMTAGKGGDSAVSHTRVRQLNFSRNKAIGFLDKALYGSLTGRVNSWSNEYINCNTAAAYTRDGTAIHFWGDKVRECGLGFGMTEGTAGGVLLPPAHHLTATACEFDNMGGRLFRIQMASARIVGCRGRNWGYSPRDAKLGIYTPQPSLAAVRMDGAFDCDIDIQLEMTSWPDSANHVGIDMRNKTLNGTTYICTGNKIRGHIKNLPNGTGLTEINGTTGTVSDIVYENVATLRSSGTGESPVRTSTSAPNKSTHNIRSKEGDHRVERNNVSWDTFFTLLPTAVGSPNVVFGAPSVNECHVQRNGFEVVTHAKMIVPFTLGTDATFTATFSGTSINITSIATGRIIQDLVIHGAGISDGTIIMPKAMATGSISGTTFTAALITMGSFSVGDILYGTGVADGTVITANLGGGQYTVSPSQTVASTQIGTLGPVNGGVGTYIINNAHTLPSQPATGVIDGDIRLDSQSFTAATGVGYIDDRTLYVTSGTGFAVGQTVKGDGILSKTVITADLGGGAWTVSRSQFVPSGPILGTTTSTARGFGGISGTTLTLSAVVSGSFAVGQGIEGGSILPGTVITQSLGANQWRVNKTQTVPAGTVVKTLPTGLPWIAAPAGGGDAEGVTGIDSGIVFAPDVRTVVGQIPAGRDFIRFWMQGGNRVLRVRDLNSQGNNFRIQTTITYRCED